jgi:hypothetical protein
MEIAGYAGGDWWTDSKIGGFGWAATRDGIATADPARMLESPSSARNLLFSSFRARASREPGSQHQTKNDWNIAGSPRGAAE